MPKASYRRLALALKLSELSMDDLAIDHDWLEVAQLVLQFSLLVLTTKEVHSFLDRVALQKYKEFLTSASSRDQTYLSAKILVVWISIVPRLVCLDTATSSLDKWCHTLLQLYLHPLEVVKLQHNHLIEEDSTLSLPTIDNHTLLVNRSTVVLPSTCRVACCLALGHASLVSVEL